MPISGRTDWDGVCEGDTVFFERGATRFGMRLGSGVLVQLGGAEAQALITNQPGWAVRLLLAEPQGSC
jgi:hypothetical protein